MPGRAFFGLGIGLTAIEFEHSMSVTDCAGNPDDVKKGGFQRKIPEKGRIGVRDRENDALGFVLRRFLWVSRYLIPPHFASIWEEPELRENLDLSEILDRR